MKITHSSQRGQTLPLQVMGIITMISLAFLILNGSYFLRAQCTLQAQAEAAASLAAAAQATQMNERTLALQAAAIEEWRLRTLLFALSADVRGSGGCDTVPSTNPFVCKQNYGPLRAAYFESVNRFTQDAGLVEHLSHISTSTEYNVAINAVSYMQNKCKQTVGCKSHFFLTAFTPRLINYAILANAAGWSLTDWNMYSQKPINSSLVANIVDVTACETLPSFLPPMFGVTPLPLHIVARAAAVPIDVTWNWLVPALTTNPETGQYFQRTEYYTPYQSTINGTSDPTVINFSNQFMPSIGPMDNLYTAWFGTGLYQPTELNSTQRTQLNSNLSSAGCK